MCVYDFVKGLKSWKDKIKKSLNPNVLHFFDKGFNNDILLKR